jgi:diguanylate cyclase (GGDEF)-like protein
MEKCLTRGLRNPAATEGAGERAAAVQGRPATKFMPFQLRSVLGRRMLIQHLCIGLLPIVALASLLYMQPNSALREVGDKFLLIAAITVALALALGVRQARRSVGPLERLLAGMRRIARQDFSALMPAQGRDEMAQLTHAYNEMARDLSMNFAALNVLLHIDQAILTRPDVGEGVRGAMRYVRYITSIDSVILGLFDGDDNDVMRLYSLRPKGRKRHDGTVFHLPAEVRQRLASLPGNRWIDNPPLPSDLQARLRNEDGVKHFWIEPVARGGRLWGIIILGHFARPALSDNQLALLAGVAGRLEAAFATVERDRKLHALAHVDALTGLPNRPALLTLLTQHLAHAHRSGGCVGVLFLDLDRFKQVNDTLGHAVGDLLLQHAAQRIRRNLREDDTVARLGGDEFTIVLGNLASARDAGSVARQLIAALLRPFEIDGHTIHVGASTGIAIYPVDGTEGNELLKNADTAMYRAKEEGRNRFAFYDENMNFEARRRATLDRELRHALKHDEFVLHYQPQIDLQTGRVCAVEALVRWRHPERGLLYPDAFIPFAEGSGLIPHIGTWVMREACLQHQRWRAAGVPIPGISVNVSNDQLRRPNFVRTVLFLLNLAQMPQGSFEIEVTESMFLEGGKAALDALHTLVRAGVKVAIDDFGTGYSSFGYLKTLPASVLKLDKSFLVDVAAGNDAATIVEALIDMAHTLRKEVVAEGVEREDQLEFLRGLGCETVQGYLYSRPLPADEIARYALARSEQYPLRAASVSPVPAAGDFRSAVVPPAGAQRAENRPNEAIGEGSDARGGSVEEVLTDDGLTAEYVIDPAAISNRSWRVLWSVPAGTSAKETMANDAVCQNSAVLK